MRKVSGKTLFYEAKSHYGSYDAAKFLRPVLEGRELWSALDILTADDKKLKPDDKLWLALSCELIDAPLLHEFVYRCAVRAMELVDDIDPRIKAAVDAKRDWLIADMAEDAEDVMYLAHAAAEDAMESDKLFGTTRGYICTTAIYASLPTEYKTLSPRPSTIYNAAAEVSEQARKAAEWQAKGNADLSEMPEGSKTRAAAREIAGRAASRRERDCQLSDLIDLIAALQPSTQN